MSIPRKKLIDQFSARVRAIDLDDETLDRCSLAYDAEYTRWGWRRRLLKDGFELYRIADDRDEDAEITALSKRECKDKIDAEAWLGTYRGRAAMKAALSAL